MLKQFMSYYLPHWRLFMLDMGASLGHSMALVALPVIVRDLLGNHISSGDWGVIAPKISLLLFLVLLASIMNFITTKYGHGLGVKIETDMRNRLFAHLQKLSFNYYDNTKTGHIMSRISNDLFTISEIAHHAPEALFVSFFTLVGAYYFMFSFNWRLALVSLSVTPFLLVWGLVFGGRLRGGFREVRKKIADINSSVENSIQGIREVKSYTGEEAQMQRFGEVNHHFKTAKTRMYGLMAWFQAVMMFLMQSHDFVVITGGIVLLNKGLLTVPDLLVFLMYNRFIGMPIRMLVHFSEQFQQGAAAFERYVEVMATEPDLVDSPAALELSAPRGEVEFENVFFKYERQSPEWIIKGVSFKISKGQTLALVGESGAGKSTLASLIPRFYDVNEGAVLIDGENVKGISQKSLRGAVGIVQQHSFLFDSTIRENIQLGKVDASDDEIIQAARDANIWDFIKSLPDGLDSQIGEHGVKLSGGQRQRIAIARCYLKNPAILIFDEATSSLDSESEKLVQDSFQRLSENRTTIIIAHRLSTVQNADVIVVLRNGKVIEDGNHQSLVKLGGYYKTLYERHIF